jgi:hypothetical protein
VFHIELHKFPSNMARFNLSTEEMLAVVMPWARGEWIEFGERKWNPHEARLTVLEGPEIPVNQLRVGRGWRLAERKAEDVTERVLAAARDLPGAVPATSLAQDTRRVPGAGSEMRPDSPPAGVGSSAAARAETESGDEPTAPPPGGAPADPHLLADSLGLQLLGVLDRGSAPLMTVWKLAQSRLPDRPASESLALAEEAVRSLLGARLIVLVSVPSGQSDDDHDDDRSAVLEEGEVERALRSPSSWSGPAEGASLRVHRR